MDKKIRNYVATVGMLLSGAIILFSLLRYVSVLLQVFDPSNDEILPIFAIVLACLLFFIIVLIVLFLVIKRAQDSTVCKLTFFIFSGLVALFNLACIIMSMVLIENISVDDYINLSNKDEAINAVTDIFSQTVESALQTEFIISFVPLVILTLCLLVKTFPIVRKEEIQTNDEKEVVQKRKKIKVKTLISLLITAVVSCLTIAFMTLFVCFLATSVYMPEKIMYNKEMEIDSFSGLNDYSISCLMYIESDYEVATAVQFKLEYTVDGQQEERVFYKILDEGENIVSYDFKASSHVYEIKAYYREFDAGEEYKEIRNLETSNFGTKEKIMLICGCGSALATAVTVTLWVFSSKKAKKQKLSEEQ